MQAGAYGAEVCLLLKYYVQVVLTQLAGYAVNGKQDSLHL